MLYNTTEMPTPGSSASREITRFSLTLPVELDEALARSAERNRRHKSAELRVALERYLRAEGEPPRGAAA